MDEAEVGGVGEGDLQPQRTERKTCNLDDLELYLRGEASATVAATIQQHLDEGCPRCSNYIALDKARAASAERILGGFFDFVQQDAKADFPTLHATLERNQSSDDPHKRQIAARIRRALRIPVEEFEFRADLEQLHFDLKSVVSLNYKQYVLSYDLKIVSHEKEAGHTVFAFELVGPSESEPPVKKGSSVPGPRPSRFDADLLLEDGTRLPLRRVQKDAGEDKEAGSEELWSWVSPPVSTAQLPRREGKCLVRIEAFAMTTAPVPNASEINYQI